eukprot:m.103698 g.103698  ORF g.103698 m.103698 type:complete len:224 (+) comp10493_c0_seq1:110-781(+)
MAPWLPPRPTTYHTPLSRHHSDTLPPQSFHRTMAASTGSGPHHPQHRAGTRRLRWVTTALVVVVQASVYGGPGVLALDNGVGLTPLMGWMSWMRFRCNVACNQDPDNCISEHLIKSTADAMVANGWRDAGYRYVSIDDCWQADERLPNGTLVPNATRFPSGMKALGDYLHERNLSFGLYTAMGSTTCGGYPAFGCPSVDNCTQARRDIDTMVGWGIDYLKVRW